MDRRDVESRIDRVTVYAVGARVHRVARVAAPFPAVVRFTDLPLSLADDSVRAEVEGGGLATAVRVGLATGAAPAAADEQSPERVAARRRVALATSEVERLSQALDRLGGAPVVQRSTVDEAPAPWAAIVTARRSVVELRAARELALRERLSTARREVEDANLAYEAVADRELRAGTARAAKLHEARKFIELELSSAATTGELVVSIEYRVTAAKWAPSYVVRLDGESSRLELRAVVAQATGEDWAAVAIQLSTALPDRFAPLPELAPQKIGKRQAAQARTGFRPPPIGSAELFADYDRAFPARIAERFSNEPPFDDSTYEGRAPTAPRQGTAPGEAMALGLLRSETWDEDSSVQELGEESRAIRTEGRVQARRAGAPAAAPAPSMPAYGGPELEESAPVVREPSPPTPRLDYSALRMAPTGSAQRGQLVAAPPVIDHDAFAALVDAAVALDQLVPPPGSATEWSHAYDYAFASDGVVDVRSDSAWSSIALSAAPAATKQRHVAVPREQADVFRIAVISNELAGPLLPGPIDVYERGRFLVTSTIDFTPPGASVEIGLGVDPTIKIARNAEYREETAGVLRGGLRLIHAIAIEVENLSPRAIDLDVRERVPTVREGDSDVELAIGKVEPAWEKWAPEPDAPGERRLRGGYRWRVAVPPSGKLMLRAGYEVKLSGKLELVGGNRRES